MPILIVEDDVTFSLMLSTWLKKKGFDVYSVTTISEARKAIEKHSFHLLCRTCVCRDGDGMCVYDGLKKKAYVCLLSL
jgi:two-component system response regulator HydG